jgi:predicted component of type VI protein secretion system
MTDERAGVLEPQVPTLRVSVRLGVSHREMRFAVPLVVIGRAGPEQAEPPQIDLSGDDSVSRRHAEIRYAHDQFWIVDRGSTNGTWLNGERLEPQQPRPLKDGDRLVIGRLSFLTIHLAGGHDADTTPPV